MIDDNKTILMIMGRSGSGKSTLERDLVSLYPELFHKVVSVTTRPKRAGEVDGVDYRFISVAEYDDFDYYNEMIQTTHFAGNHYGSLYSDYLTHHRYATLVVTPESAASFIPVLEDRLPSVNVVIIYFNISEELLRYNMIERGDDPQQVDARLASDNLDVQFAQSGLVADLIITDATLTPDLPEQVVRWLATRNFDGWAQRNLEAE